MRVESTSRGAALVGKHKWLGGALLGEAYFAVPSHARWVLKVDPVKERVELLNDEVPGGKYKWLRAVATDHEIFGIPCCGDRVLRISNDRVETLEVPTEDGVTSWRWHGGQLSKGCIYAPPANSRHVLKIDVAKLEASLIKIDGLHYRKSQFYGGILDADDAVWGIPFSAGAVLKMEHGTARAIGATGDGFDQNHHGGLCCSVTGAIFGFPANANTVIRIDPPENKVTLLPVPGPRGKYQWGGGIQCPETGIIYGIPSDAPDMLRIDPRTNHVSRFGSDFFQPYQKNKFQNAVRASDGSFYAIPSDADYVLRLDPRHDRLSRVAEGRIDPGKKDKFQGGFAYQDTIWAIPESADFVLRLQLRPDFPDDPLVDLFGLDSLSSQHQVFVNYPPPVSSSSDDDDDDDGGDRHQPQGPGW